MALQIKPHSVIVTPVTQTAGGTGVMGNPASGVPVGPIKCLAAPMKPSESFQRFGVVLSNAWTLYVEVADSGSFLATSKIRFNGVDYWQQGDAEVHENGDPADCALVYMTGLQYPVIT